MQTKFGKRTGRARRALLPVCVVAVWGAVFAGCGGGKPKEMAAPVPAPKAAVNPAPVVPEPASRPAHPLEGWEVTSEEYSRAPHAPPLVALTFDAGSDAKATHLILEQLKAHNARATFFLTGTFCEDFPEESRAIAEAGMEIGSHSYSHPHFTRIDGAAIKRELEKADEVILKATGQEVGPLFRFPYGDRDARTREAVADAGYQSFYWAVDALDAFGKPKSADFVAGRIIKRLKPGDVVLMHVSSIGTAKALPRIFAHLEEKGWKAVTVSELVRGGEEAKGKEAAVLVG